MPEETIETCNLCHHKLEDNRHGFDQNDAWMEGDKLVHSGRCTYCKECNPTLKRHGLEVKSDEGGQYFSHGQDNSHGLDEKAPKADLGGKPPELISRVSRADCSRFVNPIAPVQKTDKPITNGQTDHLRTLLDQAFDALEHDKSAINEMMGLIWKCKPTCLKCRIGVALRS